MSEKPYTLILGDCFDVLRGLEAGSVDAVVTDPPFNVGKEFSNDRLSRLEYRYFCNRFVLELYRLQPKNVLLEVSRVNLTMQKEMGRYFRYRYALCLNYLNSMRNGVVGYANWGMVLWFSNGGKCYCPYKDRLDSILHNTKGQFLHPSPKEVTHYRHLVRMFCPDGGIILDPFVGSGTTGVALRAHIGRRFIGIEIDPAYHEIARRRIEDAYTGGPLFAAAAPPLFDEIPA